jgi:hypothetical protein
VDPILMKKCNSTIEEADEFNYPECFFCLIHNCVDIGSKPKPNCADLYKCITDAICSWFRIKINPTDKLITWNCI